MNKNRFSLILIIGLLISNLVLIIFLTQPKKGHHLKEKGPKMIIIKRLNFNDEQTATYEKIIETHRNRISGLEKERLDVKQQLFTLVANENARKKDSLLTEIATLQKAIELTHFNHFIEIKGICQPDQMDALNELCEDLSGIFERRKREK